MLVLEESQLAGNCVAGPQAVVGKRGVDGAGQQQCKRRFAEHLSATVAFAA